MLRKFVRRTSVRHFGALTSRPYAFTARPWDLSKTETIDCLDGLGAHITIHSKGGEVMRVVPRPFEEINEDWLNDKSRFSYDGLKRQRLTQPLTRSPVDPSQWTQMDRSWRTAFKRIQSNFSASGPVRAIMGPSVDLNSALCLSDWVHSFQLGSVESTGSVGGTLGRDIPSQFRFNTGIQNLENSDFCVVIGSNLMEEAPLLVSRLRSVFLRDTLEVVNLGPPTDFTFPVSQLGVTAKTLVEMAEGRHPVCAKLATAQRPSLVIGSQVFERDDGMALASCIETIACYSGKLRQFSTETGECIWDGINVLHHNANDVGLLELGLANPINKSERTDGGTLFLMGVNEDDLPVPLEELAGPTTQVVYIGHHGDQLAAKASVVLAGGAFSEKNGTYINTEGRSQYARNATTPPVDAREDWKIIRALSEAVGDNTLPFESERDIQTRLELLVPSIADRGDIVQSTPPATMFASNFGILSSKLCGGQSVDCTPFDTQIHDFYLEGNVIAKSSQSMAKASAELGIDRSNFLQFSH